MRSRQVKKVNSFIYVIIIMGMLVIIFVSATIEKNKRATSDSYPDIASSILTSISPNQVHIVELQEIRSQYLDKKDNKIVYGNSSFRIYYGEYGNKLEEYLDYHMFQLATVANFEVNWKDDHVALIAVYRKSKDGKAIYKDETIRLDTQQE
ncbi:hypothetical protein CEQ21_24245 [Niallia circulans]|uniref:Uncharacterized protein n=1 Tax=Niallia circulans TaxID=1397 RepID=A0A553SND3_NIACI|nr:hypothetical protein [Niallia circulans]TRZ38501.1 hypothetical protein CEQ21_24245 [Niallia circulans]